MITRLLSVVLVGVWTVAAQAQLPSEHFSPINYFGRYHGFGYSDGYHACKEGRCNSWSLWKPWEPMSSLYSSPAPTSSNRSVAIQATANSKLSSLEYYSDPVINQPTPTNGTQWSAASPDRVESVVPAPIHLQPSQIDRGVRELPPPRNKSKSLPSSPESSSKIKTDGTHFGSVTARAVR